jgi:hypothetical protein
MKMQELSQGFALFMNLHGEKCKDINITQVEMDISLTAISSV